MDSQHRHDLQENDLADFVQNFGQWWAKYGNYVLTAVLVVAAAIFIKRFVDSRTHTAQDHAWADLANATSPESFQTVAQTYGDPAVRAIAYLRGGDLLLARATGLTGGPAQTQPALDPEGDLKQAKLMYEQVLAINDAAKLVHLNAQLGLASVAEGQRNWPAAKTIYQQIGKDAGETYQPIAQRAKARLDMLDRLGSPVVFGPDRAEPAPSLRGDTISPSLAPLDSAGPELPLTPTTQPAR